MGKRLTPGITRRGDPAKKFDKQRARCLERAAHRRLVRHVERTKLPERCVVRPDGFLLRLELEFLHEEIISAPRAVLIYKRSRLSVLGIGSNSRVVVSVTLDGSDRNEVTSAPAPLAACGKA